MALGDNLFNEDALRVPPMLLGTIRWKKAVGRPDGDLCSGFRIVVHEREPSQFQNGPAGPERTPGTGEWRLVTNSAPCAPAPDSADNHAVTFNVPDVHLNGFPDGLYRVAVQVTENWDKSLFRYLIGPPRVDPVAHLVVLTKDRPVASIEFDVYRRRFRFFW